MDTPKGTLEGWITDSLRLSYKSSSSVQANSAVAFSTVSPA